MSSMSAGRRQIFAQSKASVQVLAAAADHAHAMDNRNECVDLISRIYEMFDAEEAITQSEEIAHYDERSRPASRDDIQPVGAVCSQLH